MGLTCSSENITNSKSISYCELDKIIFIEYQYMNGIIQQNYITSYYPQLNFAEFEKEKGNRVKKRQADIKTETRTCREERPGKI